MRFLKSTLYILLFFFALNLYSQNLDKSIKPLRIGIKIGVPNLITANAEYVTPLFGKRLAIAGDYMSFATTIDDTDITYNNFEAGTNIYFNSTGKGFYIGLSYFSFDGEGDYKDVEFDNGSIEDGTGTIDFNTINAKLGVKIGRTFYFRIEAGYSLGDIPKLIQVTSNSGSQITTEEIPEIPGITTSGIPYFNIGFGIGFF
jgi:hypothetical protein